MTRHTPTALVAALLAIAACSDAAPRVVEPEVGGTIDVSITTERSAYKAGDILLVRTTNRGTGMLYDDHCGGAVEGFEFLKEWNGSYGVSRICNKMIPRDNSDMVHPIPPGTTHVDTLHVSAFAYTGTWRARLSILDGRRQPLPDSLRVTDTFQVAGWSLATVGR